VPGFLWEELGILKRSEKYPLRIVGLTKRAGPIRCLNLHRRLFLECNSGHGQDGRLPNALQFSGGAIHSTTEAKLAGRNIPSHRSVCNLLESLPPPDGSLPSSSCIGQNGLSGLLRPGLALFREFLANVYGHAMLKKRPGISTFEFEEGRQGGIAGQRGIGIETIRQPLDLHRVPTQYGKWTQRDIDRHGNIRLKELIYLTGEQASGRLGIGDEGPSPAHDIRFPLLQGLNHRRTGPKSSRHHCRHLRDSPDGGDKRQDVGLAAYRVSSPGIVAVFAARGCGQTISTR
jgi:hypothetical protein